MLLAGLILSLFLSASSLNNGRSVTPPMGWRSWNLFSANVNQNVMVDVMTAMVDKSRSSGGVPTSLKDLGYTDVGIDDNWQLCGSYGPQGYTFHSEEGRPYVNPVKFPSLNNLTDYAHSLGLTAGWYGNNCICHDHCSGPECYQGDVNATLEYGFDSIKLDGCGTQMDLDHYNDLYNASGKAIMIENCHWGGTPPYKGWCPFNYYRTSTDIRANYASILANLQTVTGYATSGLSAPGCWAYPDMLEVGCEHGAGGADDTGLTDEETRTHFAAWCIVSSPLILSLDVTNSTLMDKVWPVISNKEALAVNQAWANFSGSSFLEGAEKVHFKGSEGAFAVSAWQYWYKPVGGGKIAVLLMNHATTSASLTLTFNTVPGIPAGTTTVAVRDIWTQQDVGVKTTSYSVTLNSHDSAFLMLTPQ